MTVSIRVGVTNLHIRRARVHHTRIGLMPSTRSLWELLVTPLGGVPTGGALLTVDGKQS